ncbi:hypothetical protein [Bacillus thuringiensis]|uniref:hypothetical protein n=1 Tax=Bacillus thuringiensis TaxID=1428 RepID=UPI000BFC57E3|nr:hypothetical protein [Bacillus thuringiensis]PGT90137.1 hypothetical protein COD17_10335 [Bacillus thuringiensis]
MENNWAEDIVIKNSVLVLKKDVKNLGETGDGFILLQTMSNMERIELCYVLCPAYIDGEGQLGTGELEYGWKRKPFIVTETELTENFRLVSVTEGTYMDVWEYLGVPANACEEDKKQESRLVKELKAPLLCLAETVVEKWGDKD